MDGADVCPACLAELTMNGTFCPQCGAPVSPTAALAPFERVLAEGYVYRQAVQSPRSLMVVVGAVAIFGCMLLTGAWLIFYDQFIAETDMMMRWEGCFLLLIGSMGLYQVIRNYRNRPRLTSEADEEEAGTQS